MPRRIPKVQKQHRYRMDALPGLEAHGATTRDWSPPAPPDPAEQGRLPLDGAVLGPLFDHDGEAG